MSTSSYDSPLRGGCFSYDAAPSRTSIHSAEIQLIPHVDTSANTDTVKGGTRPVERVQKWTRGLTRSPCHQVELKCCGSQAKATLNRRAARTRETHSPQPRSTPDIINYHFINFASGHWESHAVAQMMCWKWKWAASQRWLSIGSIWEGGGGEWSDRIPDCSSDVFHHQLWEVNVGVSPTSKGAFDAHHEPPLIVGKLLQRKSIKRESNSEALYPKRKISN